MVFCREGGAGLIEPDWRYIASPDVSAHVNKNAVSDVICQPHYVIDHLFIMRFYLSFIFPLWEDTVFALIFILSEI